MRIASFPDAILFLPVAYLQYIHKKKNIECSRNQNRSWKSSTCTQWMQKRNKAKNYHCMPARTKCSAAMCVISFSPISAFFLVMAVWLLLFIFFLFPFLIVPLKYGWYSLESSLAFCVFVHSVSLSPPNVPRPCSRRVQSRSPNFLRIIFSCIYIEIC